MNPFVHAEADRCIGCRTCEVACAIAHAGEQTSALQADNFFPRLRVVKTPSISVPVICHQCENAPCVTACPNFALVRSHSQGIQVIQSLCIGCKGCVVACPFGAIDVVAVPLLTAAPQDTTHNSEAHKCDLCGDRSNGPACIEVCPTDALQLISQADLQRQIGRKQQATARDNAGIQRF